LVSARRPTPTIPFVLRIKTLGALAVTRDGRPVAGAASQPRRLAMLALLSRAGDLGVGRDRLIAVLWPDVEEERARRNLTHALYALRRDLGDEDAIQGAKDLRLDIERIGIDVREFADALRQGRLAHAVSLYGGPFLDGFHLPGVPEFERWSEDERQSLQHQFAQALETLARRATDASEAADWWRRLAAVDPLNARYSIGLMEALAASGDVAGALRHARVHEVLVAEQLDLPPDTDVVALAKRLRERRDDPAPAVRETPAASPSEAVAIEQPPVEPPVAPGAPTVPDVAAMATRSSPSNAWMRSRLAMLAGAVVVLAAATITRVVSSPPGERHDDAARPVLAVGRIADRRGNAAAEDLAGSLADMLATNLARAAGTRVVSTARMYELARQNGGSDTSAVVLLDAARRAGAAELVDGALFALGDGTLRLDVRRVEIAGGEVLAWGRALEDLLGFRGPNRRRRDRAERQAHVAPHAAVLSPGEGHHDLADRLGAARADLAEAHLAALGQREADARQELVVGSRGLAIGGPEVLGRDRALAAGAAQHQLGVVREQYGQGVAGR
jgi:DNA-binding SARP family transcriptional activator/TolB-like protein